MSEQRNVNRIYDPSLEAELREAGLDTPTEPQTADGIRRSATGRIEIPPAFPFPPPTQADLIAQELKEAGVETDLVDEVFQTQQKIVETLKEKLSDAEDESVDAGSPPLPLFEKFVAPENLSLVREALFAPRDPDLRAFKKQVIEAFKHLGLDTQKFFGV